MRRRIFAPVGLLAGLMLLAGCTTGVSGTAAETAAPNISTTASVKADNRETDASGTAADSITADESGMTEPTDAAERAGGNTQDSATGKRSTTAQPKQSGSTTAKTTGKSGQSSTAAKVTTTKPPTKATTTAPTTGTTLNAQFDIGTYVAYAKKYGVETAGMKWGEKLVNPAVILNEYGLIAHEGDLDGTAWNQPSMFENTMSDETIRRQIRGVCKRLVEDDNAEYFRIVYRVDNGIYYVYFVLA